MKTKIYKGKDRGFTNIGWLKSYHSFSFSGYYNPTLTNFGTMRVLNDDQVAPGRGFDAHPHSDMEIISIPLSGSLKHQDSMGNKGIIKVDEVQIMSAGTGLKHSEFNNSETESVQFLQIWIYTKQKGIPPHYDQKMFSPETAKNAWELLVSPVLSENTVLIHQDAYLSRTNLFEGNSLEYSVHKKGNGIYFFVLEGSANIAENVLMRRDAISFEDIETVIVQAAADTQILAIEVPMGIPSFYHSA